MNKLLLTLFLSLECLVYAQKEVVFPNDFSDALIGTEVIIKPNMYVAQTLTSLNGDINLSPMLYRSPTDAALPGSDEYKSLAAQNTQMLQVKAKEGYVYYNSDTTLRVGSYVSGLQGRVSKLSSGRYVIEPTVQPIFVGNERGAAPTFSGNYNMKVVGMNLEYYLASSNNWGSGYGAKNKTEFARQSAKIVEAMIELNADVYAICEMEEGNYSPAYLVTALNNHVGVHRYDYVDSGDTKISSYTKNIFIFNTEKVKPYLSFQTYDYFYLKMRHVAQCFELISNGERVILSMNHFKAKTGNNASGDDTDQFDGQGLFNAKRTVEAEECLKMFKNYTTYYGDNDILVLGDLNSYTLEDPVREFTTAGYTNELTRYSPNGFSYVYNGSVGYLDHSLSSPSLTAQVVFATPWQVNAEEPRYVGYNYTVCKQLTPYRYSDHNPIVTFLNLDSRNALSDDKYQMDIKIIGDSNKGYVQISAEWIENVSVFSNDGAVVKRVSCSTPSNNLLLPVADLKTGLYLVSVSGDGKNGSVKMVVK